MTEAAVAESPDQQRSRGPFLMPDGRPLDLSSFLDSQQQLRPPRGSSHSSRRPGAIKEPKQGWTKAVPHAAATSASAVVSSEAEQAEMYALSRVGHRKQRRWLNDKLLRDMAGALTAADMASLFKPAPFGETRTSLWEQAAQPEHAVLWNYFRSVEMDKQGRVLEKWQSHVRELQARPAVVHNPAVDALTAWARVNWKARQAMKRAGPCFVQATENQVLSFSEDDGAGEEMVVSGLEDGFHRLIAHGLAEFHGMPSHSRVLEDGSKEVVVRRRTQATAAGAIVAQVSRSAAHALGGGAWTDEDVAPMTPAAQPGRWPVAIACSDILQLLADGPHQPMSAAVLRHAYLQPDSSSDAGDHCYPHQPPQDQEQI